MTLPAKWTKEYTELMEKRARRAKASRDRNSARGIRPWKLRQQATQTWNQTGGTTA